MSLPTKPFYDFVTLPLSDWAKQRTIFCSFKTGSQFPCASAPLWVTLSSVETKEHKALQVEIPQSLSCGINPLLFLWQTLLLLCVKIIFTFCINSLYRWFVVHRCFHMTAGTPFMSLHFLVFSFIPSLATVAFKTLFWL